MLTRQSDKAVKNSYRPRFRPMTADLKKPTLPCNPIDKRGEGILNPVTHLIGYQVKQLHPVKLMKVHRPALSTASLGLRRST
jgi:hypothetical protein